ncbi:hypothetical protein [Pimelobacter sp. 30-1]|uniref:hypothetical protein n=1 Tax=Pimelobacter sp. 30-1 TaxID=2004991 RepID=UPI001C059281|nr:hypothetical protein [Pimelobacter sp. 30-1]MBU2693852.1 hypothetical protein [Pimelobacter sp. 30-1]
MAFFLVDDQFHGHPKARRAQLEAIGLWTVAGSHCTAYRTDGFVPTWFVSGWPRGKQAATRLVAAGLWRESEQEGEPGYQFHDWHDIHRTAEELEAERERARDRQRKRRRRLAELRDEELA